MKSHQPRSPLGEDRRVQVLDYIQDTDLKLRPVSNPSIEYWITLAYQQLARACSGSCPTDSGQEAAHLFEARIACGQARRLASATAKKQGGKRSR